MLYVGVDLQDGADPIAVQTQPKRKLAVKWDAWQPLADAVIGLNGKAGKGEFSDQVEVAVEVGGVSGTFRRYLKERNIQCYELPTSLWHRRSFTDKTHDYDAVQVLNWLVEGRAAQVSMPDRSPGAEQLANLLKDARKLGRDASGERQKALAWLRPLGVKGQYTLKELPKIIAGLSESPQLKLAQGHMALAQQIERATGQQWRKCAKLFNTCLDAGDAVMVRLRDEMGQLGGEQTLIYSYSLLPNACVALAQRRSESSFSMYCSVCPSDKPRETREGALPGGRTRMVYRNGEVKAFFLGWAAMILGRWGMVSGNDAPYLAGNDHWIVQRAARLKNMWGLASAPGPVEKAAPWSCLHGVVAHDLCRAVFYGLTGAPITRQA